MLEFLPKRIVEALRYLNLREIYEIRMRIGQPILVNVGGRVSYLGQYGLTEYVNHALSVDSGDLEETVFKAGDCSVYSVEEELKKGFLTTKDGVRLGVAGRVVYAHGQVISVNGYTSVCIRIPHEIVGCAEGVYRSCFSKGVKNMLIASLPGIGKTTMLRDMVRLLSQKDKLNVAVCDERAELSGVGDLHCADIILYADKATAFEMATRSLSPNVIVCDELTEKDLPSVERVAFSGVKLIASAHYASFDGISFDVKSKFDYFVLLDGSTVGKVDRIYEKTGQTFHEISYD